MKPFAPIVLLFILGCAETPIATHDELPGITLAFDHFGGSVNPLDQRMMENGTIQAAEKPGHNFWLRLTNNSSDVIAFTGSSMYARQPIQWYELSDKHRIIALEDGMQTSLDYEVESKRGNPIELGYRSDMRWMSFLPPGRSVTFSVPPIALIHHRRIYMSYKRAVGESPQYRVYYQHAAK